MDIKGKAHLGIQQTILPDVEEREVRVKIRVKDQALTPYKEAPALNVFLNASAAKVVYPPAEPPVMHSLSPSAFPESTCIKHLYHHD